MGRSWGTETLRDWGPTCKVRILDGRRIQLREEPRSGSLPGGVTFDERDPIEAIGWDVVNGYMHVRAGIVGCYMEGWIQIQHILAWDDRRMYRSLEDESWYPVHWKVTTSDMSVIVSRGGRSWDDIANELVHMCEADEDGMPFYSLPLAEAARILSRDEEFCGVVHLMLVLFQLPHHLPHPFSNHKQCSFHLWVQ